MSDIIWDNSIEVVPVTCKTGLQRNSIPFLRSSLADPLLELEKMMALAEAKSATRVKNACAEYAKPNHGNLNAATIAELESEDGWNWTDGGKEYLAIHRMQRSLTMWINLQCLEYASTNHGRLSTWHIQKLQSLRGWRWSGDFCFAAIKSLASWIEKQRKEYAKPNHGHLSKIEILKLESFPGWTWTGPLCWREEATSTLCSQK